MKQEVYAPPAHGDRSAGRRSLVSGAHVLLLSLAVAIVLPQVIGFLAGVLVPTFAGPRDTSPGSSVAAVRRVLAFNGLVNAAALCALPFGVQRLIREARGRATEPRLWIRALALLLTSALAILACVSGVRRFLQGSQPVPWYELNGALQVTEAVTLFAIALLVRHLSPIPKARVTRGLALAAMIAVTVHLMCLLFLGLVGGTFVGLIIGVLGLVKWALVFGLLWSARGLTRFSAAPSDPAT